MKAFRVVVDGQQLGDLGVPDVGNASVIVGLSCPPNPNEWDYRLYVGGLTHPDENDACWHYRWACPKLKEGSRVEIEIVDSVNCVPPTRRYRSDHEVQEPAFSDEERRDMRYESYLELKKEFEP